jgi:segregation and condensation protein B
VIRSDVEHIRGVDCGGVLRVLLERQLIRVLGRREIPGRPLIYATTKKFLEVFDLKDLKDLPSPKEIETFGQAINDGQVEVVESDETDSEASAASFGDAVDAHGAAMAESGDAADLSQEPGDAAAGDDEAPASPEAALDEAPAAGEAPAAAPPTGEPDEHQPGTRAETGEESDPDRSPG